MVDCTVEGMLHAKELGPILSAGTSILMVSYEHPEVYERMVHDPVMAERVQASHALMQASKTMRATSEWGTDVSVELAGAFTAGSTGVISGRGSIAHWPGGLVLAFPARKTVNGTIVLAPGDINLTFKHYITDPIALTIVDDYVTDIKGDSYQAELMRSYLEAFDEDAYATSHVGFGMNTGARWDFLELYDRSQVNGTEARAFGKRITRRECRHFVHECITECIVDAALHEDARTTQTDFSLVGERCACYMSSHIRYIDIVVHDGWVLPTKL